MFTGIVTELGTITAVRQDPGGGVRLSLTAPGAATDMAVGDSLAVNGVCLTAIDVDGPRVTVEAVDETRRRTNLGALRLGDRVNLERPVPGSGRFDGHFVQGHVDGTGRLTGSSAEGGARRWRIAVPLALAPYLVEKGSVAVDGVSLTVTAVSESGDPQAWFEVVLIPHTLDATVLGMRDHGDLVNLEVDVIAKYVERLTAAHSAAPMEGGRST